MLEGSTTHMTYIFYDFTDKNHKVKNIDAKQSNIRNNQNSKFQKTRI